MFIHEIIDYKIALGFNRVTDIVYEVRGAHQG